MDRFGFGGVLKVGWKQIVSAGLFIVEFKYIFVYLQICTICYIPITYRIEQNPLS